MITRSRARAKALHRFAKKFMLEFRGRTYWKGLKMPLALDASSDLEFSRRLDAPPGAVWRCWTEGPLLRRWFAPAPVEVLEAEIQPRSGGRFHVVMRLPTGETIPSEGCVLLADPERRLVFTDALSANFRPSSKPFFTADIHFAPEGAGTQYTVRALHSDAADRARHQSMGFADGWGKAAQQLADLARHLPD